MTKSKKTKHMKIISIAFLASYLLFNEILYSFRFIFPKIPIVWKSCNMNKLDEYNMKIFSSNSLCIAKLIHSYYYLAKLIRLECHWRNPLLPFWSWQVEAREVMQCQVWTPLTWMTFNTCFLPFLPPFPIYVIIFYEPI
jgi:hypothetical protein